MFATLLERLARPRPIVSVSYDEPRHAREIARACLPMGDLGGDPRDVGRSATDLCSYTDGELKLFRVTHDIFLGRFASRERLAELRDLKVTDILNVSDTPSQVKPSDGPFRTVTWIDIEDRTLIPTDVAISAIDTIHQSLTADDGRIYVHCMAGWNRSPTILWLYLLACGVDSDNAARLICAHAFDAVPGHSLLVDSQLIAAVQTHGRDRYLPHPRPAAIAAP